MTAPPGPDLPLAVELFAKLEHMSLDPPGVTRDAYGSGEERAHALIRQTGKDLGLEVNTDPARQHIRDIAWRAGSPGLDRRLASRFGAAWRKFRRRGGRGGCHVGHRRLRQSWC